MKYFCKSVMWGIVFVMITIIGLRMYTYNNPSTAAAIIDRLNPLVKTATLYTKTTENYEYKYPDATSKIENFTYVQTCYTNNGKKRKLEYISFGKKITPDKFLKITAKGQNVIMWEEISRKDLPQTVSRLLK